MELRDYQKKALSGVLSLFRKGKRRVCCVLPCGTGKTVIFAYMARQHIVKHPEGYVLFLVHRRELVQQAKDTFKRLAIPMDNIEIAMAQTVTRHLSRQKRPTFVICDECHHYTSKTFSRILDRFPAPCVGLTATPARLDGSGLGQIFDAMWTGPDPDWFVERGWLSEYDYFAPKVNLYDAKWMPKGADFDQQDASDKLDKIGIYGDIMEYLDPRRKTIVYAPTVAMSRKVAEEIGPLARHFDGDTPKAERDATMDAFRRGDIRVLCNCELIGEGVDVPDCDCVMLLRPTKSTALYIQQSMRCLRPNPGKKAVIYDFVGNVFRHGLPTQHHEWSLNGRVKAHKETDAEDDFAIRICSACMRAYRGKDRICPYCGHDNGKTRAEIEEEKEAELEQIRELKRDERKKAWTFEQLVELGRSRGYRNPVGWAYCVMRGRERKR